MFNFVETLREWKNKPYLNTNYENVKIFYDDLKYVKIDAKSQISLTEGILHLILKHPKEWVKQVFNLQKDVTLINQTHHPLYFCVEDSLISNDENNIRLEIKNGIPDQF